jgi:hypothetical protein
MLVIDSVVRRHMRQTSPGAFTVFEPSVEVPRGIHVAPGEALVGWYRNPSPWEGAIVAFTSEALIILDGDQSERINLRDIVDYESPPSKEAVTGVRIRTKDGFRFVRMGGSFGPGGNRKDAYSFIMVVRAVIAGDLGDAPPTSQRK